jgi:type I restriction enzyme M protein
MSDINSKNNEQLIVTEEDVKIKKVVPHLEKLGYSVNAMQFENTDISVQYGIKKTKIRSDIIVNVVHENRKIPAMVVEVKKPQKKLGELEKEQVISYARLHTPPIKFAVVTNGNEWKIFHAGTKKRIKGGVPTISELFSLEYDLSDRQRQESSKFIIEGYKTAKEIINALRKCHNIMRSNDGFTPLDAFDEMNKFIYTKTQAEKRRENKFTEHYFEKECTIEKNGETRVDYQKVQIEMQRIFDDAINDYEYKEKIFDEHSKIEICGESIYEIVKILDNKGFIETDYEMMGYAFENFLSTVFRGEKLGQYFTPRQIVDFAIDMFDVKLGEKIIDPCFGSGGFLVAAFKILRERIKNANWTEEKEGKEIKKLCQEYLFGTDINKRLSIACKINMYIHGDGRTGIYHHDGLLDTEEIKENRFDKVFTNPPFGSKISKREILEKFELAGSHRKIQRSEILFLERCIKLLKPAGQMAIVVPDIILNGANNKKTRNFIFNNCQILAVISLPSQTFIKSGATVKTSLLFLEKKNPSKIYTDKIFMAIPEKIGFDSAGRDDESELGKIIDMFQEFQKGNSLEEDETVFVVTIEEIQDRIDPKVYRPQKKIDSKFEIVPLKDLIQEKTKKIKPQDFSDTEFTVLGVNNKEGIFINRIEKGGELKQPHYRIEKNDFCYNPARINIGAIGLNKLDGYNPIITGYYRVFRAKKSKIISDFFYELLKTNAFIKFVRENTAGAVRMDLKIDDLKRWQIPLPSLEYQQVLLEKINKQKEVSNAMDIAINNLLEVDEEIFEGFDKIKLAKIVKINLKQKTLQGDIKQEVSFIPMSLLNTDNYNVDFEKRILTDVNKGYTSFQDNDLLFAKITPCMENGKMGIASNLLNGFGFGSTEFHVIRCSSIISVYYLYFFLKNKTFRQKARESMTGSAGQQRVAATFLKNFEIPVPPLETQKKIVKKLDEQFAKVEIFKKTRVEAENKCKEIVEGIFKV